MEYDFLGFGNWPPAHGILNIDMIEYTEMLRATDAPQIMCEECLCWKKYGTCTTVQLKDITENYSYYCLCPILFFDRIGIKLEEINLEEEVC